MQDKVSGAQANKMGHIVGKEVANYLGIELPKAMSNECIYNQFKAVIKYAAVRTTRFGINNDMLERIEKVILAKETAANACLEIFLVDKQLIGPGTPSRSKSANGRTTMFQVRTSLENGQKIGELVIGNNLSVK